jgi:high-affinity nickel-transport protein
VIARLDPGQRRSALAMGLVVLGLHALGFFLLLAVVVPHHYRLGASGVFAAGTGVTAYVLGLRHAFDADHIAAIDNTTRRLMAGGQRPMSVGLYFSLGHSSVVLALALAFSLGVHGVAGQILHTRSLLHALGGELGTAVSAGFLYLIAGLNLVVLAGLARGLLAVRAGRCDPAELDRRLRPGGLLYRVLGRATRAVSAPWHMYPVGVLFGLGFDTATEVALLFLAAGAAGAGLPLPAVLCLPILFAAGMSLLDGIDGTFMNFAYGWAFSAPLRKAFYNLAITGLSVLVAVLIGTIELGGLLGRALGAHGRFWAWLGHIDLNALGLIVAGACLATWLLALALWRLGRFEQRLGSPPAAAAGEVRP